MEYDPTRMSELLVGLGDVEVLSVADGERAVVLVDLPAFGRPARLVWHKRRWRCPRDGCEAGSVTELAPQIAPPRALLTSRAARWATRQAGRGRPSKTSPASWAVGGTP